MDRMRIVTAGVVVICAAMASHASAGVTVYTDRSAFLSAVAGLPGHPDTYIEDFNEFNADSATFYTNPLALNGFSAQAFGTVTTSANLVDASPFASSGKQDIDGTAYLRGQHQILPAMYYQLDFTYPSIAWGADVADVEQSGTNLQLSTGQVLDLAVTGASGQQFIGVISDTPFTSVTAIGGGGGDTVGLDNIVTVAVPEPATLAIGLVTGMGLLLRRGV